MRTYLLVVACALLLLLGQFVLPTTASPYLEDGGESFNVFFLYFHAPSTDSHEKYTSRSPGLRF